MQDDVRPRRSGADIRPALRHCPGWCVTLHGAHLGEEDWIHLSAPLPMAEGGITARACLSVDPSTGVQDGPYVLIGSREYTPAAAAALGRALVALAVSAQPCPPVTEGPRTME